MRWYMKHVILHAAEIEKKNENGQFYFSNMSILCFRRKHIKTPTEYAMYVSSAMSMGWKKRRRQHEK